MSNEEILDGNKLIGVFDGKKFKDPANYMYDLDWNKLMPAIKKFDRLNLLDIEYESICNEIDLAILCHERLSAFRKLVEGIKWYNQNKSK
jgi:hypothetical protein